MTPSSLAILLLLFPTLHALFIPSNSSIHINLLPPPSPAPSILEEVIRSIANKEKWDPKSKIRVSSFNPQNPRIGISHNYEFHVRAARTTLVVKFVEPVDSWRAPAKEFGPDLDGIGSGEDSRPVIGSLELEGPFDLRVGDEDDELSLYLPARNVTHKDLRRVFVNEGITIRIEGASKVSLFHPYDIGLSQSRCSIKTNQDIFLFPFLGLPSCAPLLSVRVAGSASLVATRTRNPASYLEAGFHSYDTIQLLSEKCYTNDHSPIPSSCSLGALSPKVIALEKSLRRFFQRGSLRLLRVNITSSSLVKFRLELERSITDKDRIWKKVPNWRTKPTLERTWFEIVAKIQEGNRLKHVLIRKLARPIVAVESSPWSNLMSNISFTQLTFLVLPPEALTLDVD